MKQIYKLRTEKKETLEKAQALVALASKEDRDFTTDEQAEYDGLIASADAISKRIENLEKVEARMKSLPADEGVVVSDVSSISGGEPVMLQDPNRGFKTIGEFALCVMEATERPHAMDERLRVQAAVSGMSVSGSYGVYGGHLVPPGYSMKMWESIMAAQNLFAMCDGYPVEPDTQSLTFPAVDETSRASTRWGGVASAWLAEDGTDMTGTKPKTRQVTVTPKEFGVLTYATNILLKNSRALEAFINRAAVEEITFGLTDAIIAGVGTTQPLGILNSDALISVDRESGQTAGTLISTNIENMWRRFPASRRGSAVWLLNQELESYLSGLNVVVTDVGGTTTVGGFSSQIYSAERNTIKGRPILTCENCSAAGTAGDIILFDPKSYLIGYRAGIQSDVSIHVKFLSNQTAFRWILEADGTPWLASALTPKNGTSTLSTMVTLASDADVS